MLKFVKIIVSPLNSQTMKRAMKFCIVIASITIFSSCATQRWTDISNSIDTESLLQQKFPVLYDRYKSGKLIVHKIEQRTEENGVVRYRVTHNDKHDDSDDLLLWQTVFMPLLN